ncbi:MAG: hypothetical protein NT043_01885, partial [Candidatus Bathyarchaeota archaeon]|nr:hypothetical protein [Candidatus Bathyarchaeota archaeon]
SGGGMAVFAKDLRKIHEEILSKAVARARMVKPNLTISSRLREGDPALEIVMLLRRVVLMVLWLGIRGWVE